MVASSNVAGVIRWGIAMCMVIGFEQTVRADAWPQIAIPPQNAAAQRTAPPRPEPGDVATRAEHLVTALASGNADGALDFFLPREPFLAIKDMSSAAGYYATLVRAYRHDIESYRAQLPRGEAVTLVRFVPSTRCAWMTIGREANRLPYWSCYGSRLVVSAGGREHTLRVQVIINWGDQWYVTHLGAIARASPPGAPG